MQTLSQYISDGPMVYYKFECDDYKKPSYIPTDESFDLWQTSELDKFLFHCEELGLDFSLYLEVFNGKTSDILIKEELYKN